MAEKHEFQSGSQEAPEGHDERMRDKFDNQETPTSKRSDEKAEEESTENTGEDTGDKAEESSEESKGSEDKSDDNEGEQKAPSTDDFQKYTDEFNEKGELSEDTYKELQEKYNLPKEVVDNYVNTTKQAAEAVTQAGFAAAGGQEQFSRMTEWARANLSEAEIQEFNESVGTSDVSKAVEAVTALRQKYTDAKGVEPNLVEGGGSPRGTTGYQSRAEMSADMRDPRYKTDEAFRAEVQRKIKLSKVL